MAGKTSGESAKAARKAAAGQSDAKAARPRRREPEAGKTAEPVLLSGGNPQIAKGYGDAPVQAYIAAMPGWKSDVGRRLDALIVRTVPGVTQSGQMELALLRHRGPGLVPQLSLLHEIRQSGLLPRHVAASAAPWRVQAQGRALSRHPRGRRTRRSPVSRLGEAGQPIARRKDVSGKHALRVPGMDATHVR